MKKLLNVIIFGLFLSVTCGVLQAQEEVGEAILAEPARPTALQRTKDYAKRAKKWIKRNYKTVAILAALTAGGYATYRYGKYLNLKKKEFEKALENWKSKYPSDETSTKFLAQFEVYGLSPAVNVLRENFMKGINAKMSELKSLERMGDKERHEKARVLLLNYLKNIELEDRGESLWKGVFVSNLKNPDYQYIYEIDYTNAKGLDFMREPEMGKSLAVVEAVVNQTKADIKHEASKILMKEASMKRYFEQEELDRAVENMNLPPLSEYLHGLVRNLPLKIGTFPSMRETNVKFTLTKEDS